MARLDGMYHGSLAGHMGAHHLYMIWLWRRAHALNAEQPVCCGGKPSEAWVREETRRNFNAKVHAPAALMCCCNARLVH